MELDMTKIENGTLALEIRMMDDGSCTEEHILFLKDGGHIGCIINEVDAPTNTPLTVKLDGHNLTAWEYDTTVAVKNRDVFRKDIALVFFYDDPPTDERI